MAWWEFSWILHRNMWVLARRLVVINKSLLIDSFVHTGCSYFMLCSCSRLTRARLFFFGFVFLPSPVYLYHYLLSYRLEQSCLGDRSNRWY